MNSNIPAWKSAIFPQQLKIFSGYYSWFNLSDRQTCFSATRSDSIGNEWKLKPIRPLLCWSVDGFSVPFSSLPSGPRKFDKIRIKTSIDGGSAKDKQKINFLEKLQIKNKSASVNVKVEIFKVCANSEVEKVLSTFLWITTVTAIKTR